MKVHSLPAEQAALTGFNTLVVLTYDDLTSTVTASTPTQTLELITVAAGDFVRAPAALKLVIPFSDASDAAFNSTLVELGDGGDTDRFCVSTQLNENGTEIDFKPGTGTLCMYTGTDTIDLLVTSTAGKALNDLDAGELHIYLNIARLNQLERPIS